MIRRIKKLENLGLVFKNYTWDNNTPDFERFNVIYGWNGSGKSTLSDLFLALENGVYDKHPNLTYQIYSDDGTYTNNQPFNLKIKVFNQDYISNNVFRLDGRANPIYILGKENIQLITEIEQHEKDLKDKQDELKLLMDEKRKLENTKSNKFTDVARTISANTTGGGEAIRRYDKRNAENTFQSLEKKEIFQEKELQECNLTLRQLIERPINQLSIPKVNDVLEASRPEIEAFDLLEKLIEQGRIITLSTVESIIIDEFKVNSDIAEWVENGLSLHKKHRSKKCKFCDQIIPEDRLRMLCQHFNDADKKIKDSIDNIIDGLRVVYRTISEVIVTDKAYLYKELQNPYQGVIEEFTNTKNLILNEINNFENFLKDKKFKTTESLIINDNIDLISLLVLIEKINDFIDKHNEKTKNFESEKKSAQSGMEKHYLSSIHDEIMELNKEIKLIDEKMHALNYGNHKDANTQGITHLKEIIKVKRSNISSSEKACLAINEEIKIFLGRSELIFESIESGYIIRRNGEIAKYISEGEKTAIAFLYFLFHLKDRDFDVNNGIIIIDDPVSSLDSSSKFQAFAFLKNAVINARQVFILTHNFDFLKLLLNWLKNFRKRTDRKANFYMLKNRCIDKVTRCASIEKLDKTLEKHETEYHYLFKLLKEFKSEGTIASVYHMPNIVRKVLDTFLMFRVPNGENSYKKLESINFDPNKKTALYKYANDQSHITGNGFDPSLVSETERNIKHLFEMMEATFPDHYRILVDYVNVSNNKDQIDKSSQEVLNVITKPEIVRTEED